MSASTLAALADARTLACLSGWEPAGSLVEEAYLAAKGEGSLAARDARRLSLWARKWAEVPIDLQSFYAEHDTHPAVHRCLWRIFGGYRGPDGWQRKQLAELWEAYAGEPARISLVWP